jgi:hypothetical protein
MEPTVLAGAIEFTPAEIAAIIAVLIGLFLLVTAPGWLVLAHAAGRRPAPATRSWPRTVGGAALGIGICSAAAALFSEVGDQVFLVGIVAGWVACWGLAARLRRRPRVDATATEGWGR